ncbi:MAG TPA: hypothetical protein VF883_20790 [Thermoanaerobaculia bacterium]|jgi:hypothetical protein
MQHVTIDWKDEALSVSPVSLWRDDQSIMWSFAPKADPRLYWGGVPGVVFQPAGGKYVDWPGTRPQPLGLVPENGNDRRNYLANGESPNLGTDVIYYHYDLHLHLPTGETVRLSELLASRRAPLVVGSGPGSVEWIDPEIPNQPQP